MREYRSLTLPQMGRRTFLAASFGLLGVCAAAAAGMRMSLTDYNDDPGALDALSYQLTPSTKNIVSLYSAERVLEEMKAEGIDPSSYSLDEPEAFSPCLERTSRGWQPSFSREGSPVREPTFIRPSDPRLR